MEFGFDVEGLAELENLLDQLPNELERRNVLRDALKQAGEVIKNDAVALCPVYKGPASPDITPGLGRDSIKLKVSTRNSSVRVAIQTGAGDFKGETFYMAFLEFGHHLGKRTKTRYAFSSRNLRQFVQPHPYMRPAFDRNIEPAKSIITRAVIVALSNILPSVGLSGSMGDSEEFTASMASATASPAADASDHSPAPARTRGPANVTGYHRKDGKFIKAYHRSSRGR